MPRFFTLQEAERALPAVADALRRGVAAKTELQESTTHIRDLARKVAMMGGMSLGGVDVADVESRRKAAAAELARAMSDLEESGCLVKDLDIGLVDFPTLYHDREVYLCWRLGESGIAFWHEVEAGFRGRKRIDAEFLEHHCGGDN